VAQRCQCFRDFGKDGRGRTFAAARVVRAFAVTISGELPGELEEEEENAQ
jgi:hypothetical protein